MKWDRVDCSKFPLSYQGGLAFILARMSWSYRVNLLQSAPRATDLSFCTSADRLTRIGTTRHYPELSGVNVLWWYCSYGGGGKRLPVTCVLYATSYLRFHVCIIMFAYLCPCGRCQNMSYQEPWTRMPKSTSFFYSCSRQSDREFREIPILFGAHTTLHHRN